MKDLIFITLIFLLSCCNSETNSLDSYFELLEKHSPEYLIEDFKNSSLDSVVINNFNYNKIFVDAANIVFKDPEEVDRFEEFFKRNEIELEGNQVKWAIIAAFHKKLNGEKYKFPELLDEMIELSNRINEEKYGVGRKE